MAIALALEAVKQINGDFYVFELPEDTQVVFKLPSYKQAAQYAQILSIAETEDLKYVVYDYIIRQCVIDQNILLNPSLSAGLPQTISKLILYLSGVDERSIEYTEQLLELGRDKNQINTVFNIMKRRICVAFSAYKIEDVEKLSYQQLIDVYLQAEQTLIEQGIIEDGHRLMLRQEQEEQKQPFEKIISKDSKEYQKFELDSMSATQEDVLKARAQRQALIEQYKEKRSRGRR